MLQVDLLSTPEKPTALKLNAPHTVWQGTVYGLCFERSKRRADTGELVRPISSLPSSAWATHPLRRCSDQVATPLHHPLACCTSALLPYTPPIKLNTQP